MTRNFGTNLRSVMPTTFTNRIASKIDFLFFPQVNTGESIFGLPWFFSFAFHGPAFALAKLLWPKNNLYFF